MADGIRIKIGLDGVQQVQAGAAAAAGSLDQIGKASARTGQQTAQLSAQIQDFFVQVQAGGSPLTALIQQGSQLSAVYGGVGNAARAVVGLLTPMNVALGGAAVALGAVVLAYKQGSEETDAYNRALILTGNIAGTTAGQLKEMAKAQAAVSGSQAQAAAVLTQLAASGQVAASELSKATSAANRLERAGGPAAEETARKFIELGKNPLQAVARLNEAENFLTVSVYKQIRALEIQGKQAEAAAVAQKAYADALEGRGGKLEQQLGFLQRLWRDLKKEASEAWDIMLGIGREDTLEERLKRAQERMKNARSSIYSPGAVQYGLRGEAEQDVRAISRSLLNQTEAAAAARATALETQKTIEETDKLLQVQAAKAQAVYSAMAATINGQIEAIQNRAKLGLLGPIGAIEEEGKKRIDLLKAERRQMEVNLSVARETVGGQATVERLLGEIRTQNIKIDNEQAAIQYRVAEAIYAREKATRELLAAEQEQGRREVAEADSDFGRRTKAALDSVREYAQGIEDANKVIELEMRLVGASAQARSVAIEQLRLEQAERKKLDEIKASSLLPADREAANQTVREATAKASAAAEAKAYLEEYQRIYDDLSQGLTNAIIEGGKSARDYLRSLFRSLVLQPLLRPLVAPISGLIASAGAGTSFADTGAAGGSALGQVGQAASLYDAGQKIYAGFESGFAGIGTAAKGAYFSMFESGAVGSANAAQIAAASGEAGYYGSTASGAYSTAAGTSANAAMVSNIASTAAGVAVGVMAGRAISGGYSAIGGNSGNTAVNVGTAIGAIWGPIGAALGGAIGGVVNRAFGRKAPEVEGRSIEGTITGGDFAGSAITSILEKGGWFRSDKRSTESQAITGDLDKALDEGATQLSALAKKYGDALGLPVDQLANVSAAIKVKVTDDATENSKAIADALGQYADALLGTFADQVEPFRKSGETVAQAIERVGGALLGVNDVLDTLGLQALATSIDGGKAAVALTDLFGGAGNFAQASANYYQKFYSEAERAQTATAQITEAITGLGLAAPTTREAFRALVEAQDLTTDSGRNAFATLLGVSDAFDALQTAAGNAGKKLEEVAAERRQLEEDLLRAQGDTAGLRAREREALDASNRALYDQVKALEDQKAAADAAAEAAKKLAEEQAASAARLNNSIDSNIGKFLSPEDNRQYQAQRISSNLAAVGLDFSAEQLLGASKQSIYDFVRSFVLLGDASLDTKAAVVEAAGALADLIDAANEAARQDAIAGVQAKIAEINKTFGDLTVIDTFETLSETFVRNRSELQRLEEGFDSLMGTVGRSVQDALRDIIEKQKALDSFQAGLADSIAGARLRTLSPDARIAAMRANEAALFAQLGSAADPVSVAQKLQASILDRIREEATLRRDAAQEAERLAREARDAQIDTLRQQITSFERLRDLAQQIGQFTGSLRFSDLSPLSYGDQLGSARSLFESTLLKAQGGDQFAQGQLTGNARAYLEEARAYFASSADYAAIFAQVTGALDSLGGTAGSDQSLITLQSQLEALEKLNNSTQVEIDTSAQELQELTNLASAVGLVQVDLASQRTNAEALAREQIDELRTVVEQQKAQIAQQAEIARQLLEQLKKLNETTEQGVNADELEAARP
jgi:hypothetical protein